MVRIVLAESQPQILDTIASLLRLEQSFEVIGTATDGEEALKLIFHSVPDLVIMNIEMPGITGLEAAVALIGMDCKVILLSNFAKSGYYERVQAAQVDGYFLKDTPSEQLIMSIPLIMEGVKMISPELIDKPFEEEIDCLHGYTETNPNRKTHQMLSVLSTFIERLDKNRSDDGHQFVEKRNNHKRTSGIQ